MRLFPFSHRYSHNEQSNTHKVKDCNQGLSIKKGNSLQSVSFAFSIAYAFADLIRYTVSTSIASHILH